MEKDHSLIKRIEATHNNQGGNQRHQHNQTHQTFHSTSSIQIAQAELSRRLAARGRTSRVEDLTIRTLDETSRCPKLGGGAQISTQRKSLAAACGRAAGFAEALRIAFNAVFLGVDQLHEDSLFRPLPATDLPYVHPVTVVNK